jgi:hypothetical protein
MRSVLPTNANSLTDQCEHKIFWGHEETILFEEQPADAGDFNVAAFQNIAW